MENPEEKAEARRKVVKLRLRDATKNPALAVFNLSLVKVAANDGFYCFVGRVVEDGKVEIVTAVKDDDAKLIPMIMERFVKQWEIDDKTAQAELKRVEAVNPPTHEELMNIGSNLAKAA